jgi:hypothetical protein
LSAPSGSRRGLLIFLVVAGVLSGLLVAYTISHRRPPIPADRDHAVEDPDACLSCHGPGRKDARGPNHPLNDRCFDCHERR